MSKKAAESSSDSDDSSEEDTKKPTKAAVAKKATPAAPARKASKKQESSSEESDESSDEDVQVIAKGKANGTKAAPAKAAKKVESSDEDSDSDESEDEKPKKAAPRKQSNVSNKSATKKAAPKKKQESESEEEDAEMEEENAEEDAGANEHSEIFVGNLSFQTTEDGVRARFKKYGNITNVKVPSFQGRSKGIAFVEFAKPADAKKALAENGQEFDGRNLKVTLSNEKPPAREEGGFGNRGGNAGGESSTIFVGNLGFRTTADALRNFFSECGDVKDVRIPMNEEGRPKGFAHVEFETSDAAQAALKYNGEELDGR